MILTVRISILTIFTLVFVMSTAQTNENQIPDSTIKPVDYVTNLTLHDSIIDYGKLFMNTPYRYGANGTSHFDCSGFTTYVFRNFGYNLSRTSASQSEQTLFVKKEELKKGDLVFFEGRRRNGIVGHVGIVVDVLDEGNFDFIHASLSKGITISNSREKYYATRYLKGGRVIDADSLIKRINTSPDLASLKVLMNSGTELIPAVYHTVETGETMSSIAHKYGVSLTHIKKLNKLKNAKLEINQQLKIKESFTIKTEVQKTAENITPNADTNSEIHAETELKTTENADNTELGTLRPVEPKIHTVIKGESLYSIARMHNLSLDELKKINKLRSGKIVPGQKLQVSETNFALSVNQKTEHKKPTKIEHKVTEGESLFSIARTYKVSVEKIRTDNHLHGSKIHPGQILTIELDNASL